MNSYWLMSRYKFRVLEKLDRVKKRLDLRVSQPAKRGQADLPPAKNRRADHRASTNKVPISQPVKRRATQPAPDAKRIRANTNEEALFECGSRPPIRRGVKPKRQCWICGYKISGKSGTVYSCCTRESHRDCWDEQHNPTTRHRFKRAKCSEVKFYLLKDRMTPDHNAKVEKLVVDISKDLHCGICNDTLEECASDTVVLKDRKKNHYLMACKGVPGMVLSENFTQRELSERIAAIGLCMKLGAVDRITKSFTLDVSSSDVLRNDRQSKKPPHGGGD